MDWTPDRVGTLRALRAEGKSCSEIARILRGGLTRNAVIGKLHRLGLLGKIKRDRKRWQNLGTPLHRPPSPPRPFSWETT